MMSPENRSSAALIAGMFAFVVLIVAGPRAYNAVRARLLFDPGHDVSGAGAPRVQSYRSGNRGEHATTLLADGRVLVSGGEGPMSAAEVYDPSGRWDGVAPMAVARTGHSATLLTDGRVLVAGGSDLPERSRVVHSLASAEVFDPSRGTWTATLPMLQARQGHAAARLADGRVLVVGGYGTGNDPLNPLSSAELFDPDTGSWRAVPAMHQLQVRPVALTLGSGRVLVLGGKGGELYDPVVERWTPTNPSCNSVDWAGMLPDGTVVALYAHEERLHLYDPSSDTWTAVKPATGCWHDMGWPPRVSVVMLPDGRLLASGGFIDNPSTGVACLVDPRTGMVAAAGPMTMVRSKHTSVVLSSGKALVFGGVQDWWNRERFIMPNRVVTSEVFDPGTGAWAAL